MMDDATDLAAASALREPLVRQFVIYLENRVGVLLDLTRTLGAENIHICGISIIDTADAAVARVVVDDPDHCREVLHRHNIPATETPVVVVAITQSAEHLEKVLRPIVEAEVNLHYAYSLMVHPRDKTLIVIHCEDPAYARQALEQAGLKVVTQSELSR